MIEEQSMTLNSDTNLLPDGDSATIKVSLRVRRKTSSQWLSYANVIPLGEPCYSTDTGEIRIGDGVNLWSNLLPSIGIHPDLYMRESVLGDDGIYRQYTRIIVDDGELM